MTTPHLTTEAGRRRRSAGGRASVLAACFLFAATGAAAQTASPVEPSRAAETVSPPASPPAVEILRGSAATPPTRVEPAAGPEQRRTIAGKRVWFVDEGSGTLTGCRLINTINVGRQAIRCTERPLPKGRPKRN
jgi:hypothetical protein